MYISSLLINVGDNPDRPRPGRLWLRNLYRVHQRLCMAFPSASRLTDDKDFLQPFKPEDFGEKQVHIQRGSDHNFLFRIDPVPGGSPVILVQSAVKPDWDYAFHNAGYLLRCYDVKPFEPDYQSGQVLRFRLLANPTRKIDTKTGPDGKKNNGQRVPIPTDKLEDWLAQRAQSHGFCVEQTISVQPGYVYVRKRPEDEGKRLRSARYDGVLKVIDPALLHDTIISGIGPGKAFGFGLLSVAPLRSEM